MVEIINIIITGFNALVASIAIVFFFLNIFKKKSILDKFDAWESGGVSFMVFFIFGMLTAAGFVIEPDKLLGFSLGTCIFLSIVGILAVLFLFAKIGEWFENLPET